MSKNIYMCELEMQCEDKLHPDILEELTHTLNKECYYCKFGVIRILDINEEKENITVLTKVSAPSEYDLKQDLINIGYMTNTDEKINKYLRR